MYGKLNDNRIEWRNLNFRLILSVLALSVVGVFVVHSATSNEVTASLVNTTVKQIMGVMAGAAAMFIIALFDYQKLVKYSWVFVLLSVASLIYVRFFTAAIYGAHRWIYFPLLGTIQPSEFAKPAMILFMTFVVFKIGDRISRFHMLLLYLIASAPVLVLVLIEPDLSTSIVLMVLILTVLFLSGISYKWVLGVMAAMIPFILLFFIAVYQPGQPILTRIFEEHQMLRINAYFFPDDYPAQVYQQNTSIMAIGSGGLFGKGLNNAALDSVKNGNFLSEESCDFIFAVIGEELGFAGSVVIILVVGLVVLQCFLTARKCKDKVGKIIAGTVGGVIGAQSFINIAVSLRLIPNTGIPLPFVSAGLSSLLSTYIMIGLVLSVGMHGKPKRRMVLR